MSAKPRVLWLAGTRGEVHRLAPLHREIRGGEPDSGAIHWFAFTGEQGMGAYQAVDTWELRLDEELELRHPAEDPAIRLNGVMVDVEALIRRHRADRVIVTGCGPTAAAAGLVAHARDVRCLWLRPYDPTGLIGRLRWERGLISILGSLRSNVTGLDCVPDFPPARPPDDPPDSAQVATEPEPADEKAIERPPGRRDGHPLVQIAVARRQWIIDRSLDAILRDVVRWARAYPDIDWMIHRTLDVRMEGVLRSMPDKPGNLLAAPPVPLNVYESWLGETDLVVTDSPNIAAEAHLRAIPAVLLCDTDRREGDLENRQVLFVEPKELSSAAVEGFLTRALGAATLGEVLATDRANAPPDVPVGAPLKAPLDAHSGDPRNLSLWSPNPHCVKEISHWIS